VTKNLTSDDSRLEKRHATEERVTAATLVEKVKHLLPNASHSCNGDRRQNNGKDDNNRSYTRMWKRRRRRKVSDDSLLNDVSAKTTKSEVNTCQRLLPVCDDSAKSKLLTIVQVSML
jgi:hypothetical protein